MSARHTLLTGPVQYLKGVGPRRAEKLEKAAESYQHWMTVQKDLPPEYNHAIVFCSAGNVLADLGRDEEARGCYQKALTIAESTGNLLGRSVPKRKSRLG